MKISGLIICMVFTIIAITTIIAQGESEDNWKVKITGILENEDGTPRIIQTLYAWPIDTTGEVIMFYHLDSLSGKIEPLVYKTVTQTPDGNFVFEIPRIYKFNDQPIKRWTLSLPEGYNAMGMKDIRNIKWLEINTSTGYIEIDDRVKAINLGKIKAY